MLRKVNSTVILYRNGVQVVHEPGAIVDLTDKEFEDLRSINPDCLAHLSEAEVALIEKQEAEATGKKTSAKKAASKAEGDGEGDL